MKINKAQLVFNNKSLTRRLIFGYLNITSNQRVEYINENKCKKQIKNKKENIKQIKRIFILQRKLLECNMSIYHLYRGMTKHNNYIYWMLVSIQYDERFMLHNCKIMPYIDELDIWYDGCL